MPDLNKYKYELDPEVGRVIDDMAEEISKAEDKRALNLLNAIGRDSDFINSIKQEDLPLYINHKFATSLGQKLLAYRLKTNAVIDGEKLNDIILKNIDLITELDCE